MAELVSAGSIAVRSLHATLSGIPAACFIGALITDYAYYRTADMQWANFSAWLLAAGIVTAIIAAIAGGVQHFMGRRTGGGAAGWLHGAGTVLVLLLALFNNFVHSRDGWTSVVPTGLTLSILTVLALIVTAALGIWLAERTQPGVIR